MSTAQLIEGRGGLPAETTSVAVSRPEAARRLPLVIAGALLLVVLYAAFDHGAVALSVNTRLQVVIATIAAIGAAGWLAAGTVRLSAPRIAFAGVALLAGFACWSGVSLIWSVSPDQTWIELNRSVAYVIVLCLAIAIGASHTRAVELVAKGFLAVALAVTAYALGQKLFPGLHVTGVFDLNQTGALPRLQEPLGYWNALALFIALGVPTALALAADATRPPFARLAAAAAVELMVLTIGLTYSRGGLLALAVALIVAIAAGGEALRSTLWLALGIVGAVPPLAYGLASHSLTTPGIGLGSREAAGAMLAGVLAASLAALILGGRVLLALEPGLQMGPALVRRARRWAATAVAVLVVGGVLAVALSSRGLSGTVSHAWKSFTSTQTASNVNPGRLLSADSENRWVWWKEAANAFGDRPIGGWGAGSFGVVHLLYRRDTLPVQQPHSVPLQFLAETGVLGTLLAITAFALLLTAAVRGIRRHAQRGPERRLAAALLAAAVAYVVHALYDWDWNIPAVTLPALMFLGLLAGSGGRVRGSQGASSAFRPLWLGALCLWLCSVALSAALPSIAASKASSALVAAASGSPRALRSAQASAALATRLDPLSDAGLRAEAAVALHRGQLVRARNYLQQSVARNPTDGFAWEELAQVDAVLRDTQGARFAFQRVVALDPRGQAAQASRARK